MQKITYYIIAIVVLGVALSSVWVYQRYFKPAEQSFLYFTVDRGDIQESVRVRGEVAAQKEYELEFPFSGTIGSIAVRESDVVSQGARLMTLETKDLETEQRQLAAVLAERKADLAKIRVGASAADIRVSESRLASAVVAREEAKKYLIDKIKDAYTKSDDAVRTKTDQLFENPRSANPSFLRAFTSDDRARLDIEQQRLLLETLLNNWSATLPKLTTSSDLTDAVSTAKQVTTAVSNFLNTLSPVMSSLQEGTMISQTSIDKYNADISAGRANVNIAITNLVSAEEKLRIADASVTLSQNELELKLAPARDEDIAIAETRIAEAESRIDAVIEKIRKSTLLAPAAGRISRIHYEVGEVFRPGQSAVSMVTTGYKLFADVSELDIAKVRQSNGSGIRVQLDAFPGVQFVGKVTTIDAKEVIKTEDKYYRVNMTIDSADTSIRSGMSADVTILSSLKKGVLRVPAIAVYNDGENRYVKVISSGATIATAETSLEKVVIQTGVTDGEFIEVLRGLTEGQTVVVSAE